MPKTTYKQDQLWKKKATIFLLISDGISMRKLAKLLGCARDTLRKFINSSQYLAFLNLLNEDIAIKELIKIYPELSLKELAEANSISIKQVFNETIKRESELPI